MAKKASFLILFICFFCYPTQYGSAIIIVSGEIFRDNIVYESGAFTGVANNDTMKASVVLSDVTTSQTDYLVHLTSQSPTFVVDVFLESYRLRSPNVWEYASVSGLPDPDPIWEDVTYNFEVVNSSDHTPVDPPQKTNWYIPNNSVADPVDIPTWVSFSGDLTNPTISWGPTFSSVQGDYALRIYELNPDGSFDYSASLLSG